MARVSPEQTSMNAGEFSPVLEGRSTDFQKYHYSLRRARNILLSTTGAAYVRPGTRYLHEVKTSSVEGRLYPFLASPDIDNTEVYMLEFGESNFRINKFHALLMANDVSSTITNGTFTSNINDWDDISAAREGEISHDATNGRLVLGGTGLEYEMFDDLCSSADWTTGANWSHDAGNGEYDAAAAFANLTLANGNIQDEVTYRIDIDFSAYTSGDFVWTFNGGTTASSGTETPSGTGVHSFELTSGVGNTGFIINPTNLTASITQITVTEININAGGHAEQDVTTSNTGTEHVLRFKTEGTVGARVKVQIGTASGGAQTLAKVSRGIGWHLIAFTPSTSPYYLQFINETENGEPVYVDDVEILDNVPIELPTPYTESGLPNLHFVQSSDVLYITNGSVPYRLERYGDKSWSLVKVEFDDGPWGEINPERRLSEDNLIPDGTFDQGIKGWSQTTNDNLEWDGQQNQLVVSRRNTSPNALLGPIDTTSPDTEHVVHVHITGGNASTGKMAFEIGSTSGGSDYLNETELNAGWYSWSFTPGKDFYTEFTGVNSNEIASGMAAYLVYNVMHNLMEVSGTDGSVTVTALGDFEPFVSTDVGRAIRLEWPGYEPGWGIITAYTDSQTVTVQTRRKFAYADVPTETWRMGLWSDTTGWPATMALFESRSVWDGGSNNPNVIVFSQSADLQNMRPDSFVSAVNTTEDDDGLRYTLASNQITNINWLVGDNQLIIGTAGGQWVARSDGITITATDIDIKQQTQIKSSEQQPVAIGDTGVFVEAGKRRVYDVGYSIEADQFVAADITVLADHMFRRSTPCGNISYQQRPTKNIWCERGDGLVPVLKYDRTENIVGWTLNKLAGSFGSGDAVVDSIAVKPGSDDTSNGQVINSGDRDEVWMIIKRTIDGNTVRYVEVLEGIFEGPLRNDYASESAWQTAMLSDQKDAFHVDCGITIEQASDTAVSGLDHLEGESVKCWADGAVQGPYTVTSGAITLGTAAAKIQVGLAYTWEIEFSSMPFGTQIGSSTAKAQNFSEVAMKVMDAGGTVSVKTATYDADGRAVTTGETIDWTRPTISGTVPLFTGIKTIQLGGSWEPDASIYLTGSDPCPFMVLSVTPIKVTQNR